MNLPILTGATDGKSNFHHWNHFPTETNLLSKIELIAKIIGFVGNLLIFAAIIGLFYFAGERA
jgi:hypothetical protein